MSEAHAPPKHPYHLVAPSIWPLVGAIAAGLITTGGVLYMHGYGWTLLIIGAIAVLATMAVWWRDVVREATFQGYHTPVVQLGLRYGMALFIASEVMFFAAFFWAFFASSLFPVGGTSKPTITSGSRRPPGIGNSSTSCGCFCLSASIGGARAAAAPASRDE